MPAKPLVSCICPTFNCPPYHMQLLEECVYWFLEQEYDNKELVILNDNPRQKLICREDGVTVYNSTKRFASLGEKYNRLVELAEGEVILPWEDDDISLPHRIKQAVERLGQYQYWNPHQSWFEDRAGLHYDHQHGYCLNASAIHKTAFDTLKFANVSGSQDADFATRAELFLDCSPHSLISHSEWSYVYRWGVRDHLSGHKNMAKAYRDADTSVPGSYVIEPTMYRDYAKLCRSKK